MISSRSFMPWRPVSLPIWMKRIRHFRNCTRWLALMFSSRIINQRVALHFSRQMSDQQVGPPLQLQLD